MRRQSARHGISQSGKGRARVRRGGVAPAISTVDLLVCIEEKSPPRQVVVEVEDVEVDPAHAGQANENELTGEIGNLRIKAGNLPVEDVAIESVLTAEHDEHRLAALASEPSSLTIITQPE